MYMKNLFLKLIAFAIILVTTVSCEDSENEAYCEGLTFSYEGGFDGDYYYATLKATEVSIDENVVYEWTVNGEIQDTTSSDIFLKLAEGDQKICVSIATTDCPLGVSYCETLSIENEDDTSEKATEEENDETTEEKVSCEITTYPFTYYNNDGNAVVGIEIDELESENDNVYYEWEINGEYEDNEGASYFETTFTENGTYEICVLAETPECPNGVIACEAIVINQIEEEEEVSCEITTYPFTYYNNDGNAVVGIEIDELESENDNVYYEWEINGEYEDNEGASYFETTFTENGTYEICVLAETPECPNGVIACETIVIDQI